MICLEGIKMGVGVDFELFFLCGRIYFKVVSYSWCEIGIIIVKMKDLVM